MCCKNSAKYSNRAARIEQVESREREKVVQTLASPKKTQQLNRDEPVAQISNCIMAGLDRKRGADFIAMLQEIGGKVRSRSMCCVCVCVYVYIPLLASLPGTCCAPSMCARLLSPSWHLGVGRPTRACSLRMLVLVQWLSLAASPLRRLGPQIHRTNRRGKR